MSALDFTKNGFQIGGEDLLPKSVQSDSVANRQGDDGGSRQSEALDETRVRVGMLLKTETAWLLLARSLECGRKSRPLADLRDGLLPKLISSEVRVGTGQRGERERVQA